MKLKRLNTKGFSHHFIIPVLAIVAVAGIGAYVVTRSKAATVVSGTSGVSGPTSAPASPVAYITETRPKTGNSVYNVNTIVPSAKPAHVVIASAGKSIMKSNIAYSPNKKLIAWEDIGSDSSAIVLYNVANKQSKRIALPKNTQSIRSQIAWSFDSKTIAFLNGDTDNKKAFIYKVDVTASAPKPALVTSFAQNTNPRRVVFSQNNVIVFSTSNGILSVKPGEAYKTVLSSKCIDSLQAKPGTNIVAFTCATNNANGTEATVQTIDIVSKKATKVYSYTTSKASYINGNSELTTSIDWSPNGDKLALLQEKQAYKGTTECGKGTVTRTAQVKVLSSLNTVPVKSTIYGTLPSVVDKGPTCAGADDLENLMSWNSNSTQVAFNYRRALYKTNYAVGTTTTSGIPAPQRLVSTDLRGLDW